jgi:hypothetical protein
VLDPGSPRHGGSCRALLDVQEVRIQRKTADRVSNLSAGPPRDALRSLAPPASFTVDELQRCGAEHSAGEQCLAAALASHGRSHRFDPCHAHHTKPQVTPAELRPRCRSGTRHGSAGPRWGRGNLAGESITTPSPTAPPAVKKASRRSQGQVGFQVEAAVAVQREFTE